MRKRSELRDNYHFLLCKAIEIIESLDIKDKNGMITDSGFVLIDKVMKRLNNKQDISEQIEIIGKEKWNKLNIIWESMKIIEKEDKKYINIEES